MSEAEAQADAADESAVDGERAGAKEKPAPTEQQFGLHTGEGLAYAESLLRNLCLNKRGRKSANGESTIKIRWRDGEITGVKLIDEVDKVFGKGR